MKYRKKEWEFETANLIIRYYDPNLQNVEMIERQNAFYAYSEEAEFYNIQTYDIRFCSPFKLWIGVKRPSVFGMSTIGPEDKKELQMKGQAPAVIEEVEDVLRTEVSIASRVTDYESFVKLKMPVFYFPCLNDPRIEQYYKVKMPVSPKHRKMLVDTRAFNDIHSGFNRSLGTIMYNRRHMKVSYTRRYKESHNRLFEKNENMLYPVQSMIHDAENIIRWFGIREIRS